jgi:plasmid stabilization system protein ParE
VKRYVLSAPACAEVDGVWDYIAERSSAETATEFVWKFYEMFASIAASPAAGVAVSDLKEGAWKFPNG